MLNNNNKIIERTENDNRFWVSHSKMDVARKCMKLFDYKYIQKIKTDVENIYADFGSFVHEVAEHYKGEGKEKLIELFKNLVPSKFKIHESYKHKIPLALKNVHSYYANYLKKQIEFKNELNLAFALEDDIIINGKIDILIKTKKGKWRVVDYKTKKTYKFYDPKDQLAMYMLLLHNIFDIPYEDIECEIVYVSLEREDKYGNIIPNEGYKNISKVYKVTYEDVKLLEREIRVLYKRIHKNIETNTWLSNPSWFNCTFCDYKDICEDSVAETP